MPTLAAGGRAFRARNLAVPLLALGFEWGRVLAERAGLIIPALVVGGMALAALALPFSRAELGLAGLAPRALATRCLAGAALAVLLLLPAFLRVVSLPRLSPGFLLPAAVIAAGEEIAFRGAAYAAIESMAGALAAVAGSALLFTAAHMLSHPASFWLPVAALGVLLGAWRWVCRDLVAPIVAHTLADLAL